MGTLYCLHRENERLIGTDPVPCPFCGHGHEEEAPVGSDPLDALGIEDSTSALQHALATDETESPRRSRPQRMRGYW